jgi:predicted RND superfamily exporter protein
MVLLLFRSWKIGTLVMLEASLPILLFFGLMGWNGIALNVNTCMIASIALGITVDNCIHYLVHFQRGCHSGLSISQAARRGLIDAGGPMVASACALALGFLVFALSRFVPVAHFGWLSSFTMGVNLLADFFLMPALMLLLSSRAIAALQAVEHKL